MKLIHSRLLILGIFCLFSCGRNSFLHQKFTHLKPIKTSSEISDSTQFEISESIESTDKFENDLDLVLEIKLEQDDSLEIKSSEENENVSFGDNWRNYRKKRNAYRNSPQHKEKVKKVLFGIHVFYTFAAFVGIFLFLFFISLLPGSWGCLAGIIHAILLACLWTTIGIAGALLITLIIHMIHRNKKAKENQ